MISPSARIAASSVIEPGVIIGARVRIGPFCFITAGVEIGEGTTIASHVVINGLTRIGRDNVIDQFSSIGEAGQDLKYAGEPTTLALGDRNRIGKYATLHRGTAQGCRHTAIGDDNHLLDNVHIAHDCIIGNATHIGNNSGLAGHVELGDGGWVGARCAVHQFCIIGAHARLADGTLAVQDLPPFVQAGGNRAKPDGLHLLAPAFLAADEQQQRVIHSLYAMLYHQATALEDVRQEAARLSVEYPLLRLFTDFFTRSTRGIIR
ncbi:acyl-ACP--UDP-N-acetylglucosamine O-acyltransferase [Serratia plymuthica]|uniref:Acyl-ACP--UDP-N-acetylglucosamine O-acyltransferase n=1 Tax=Serratia plymuthica TaxID=82996 RepID=A0A7T2SSM7_SERPL|nr:acyl-ACP--UDP-N-acetylglucosamine O-acyltransferase [Serratia plymuthica]QPS20934.1 acyl-ACP--UDP-N-acetylglucosamine O-acyltransferase [Serratia plymuthica]QPS62546.1 acyl-ACP--UDP-N-acetylglucosamine O-acyltransferase [Serratia plymuthica]RKS65150.1 acyl-[acyl-carrier-protein]--UDP-N-acetylglucosamine O-acyltransferase [Serratia plymuthica]UNK25901.1 acyl-ACP--UDP-N-acetylglucosamine O-acyltransferase [Serratia plymuthica]CAI2430398.1 Acyl-[acyl-carrier-protein]--UDP-N-acetylglucosamine O